MSAILERVRSETALAESASHPRIEVGPGVAGLDPGALVAAYGSPLFVYDLDALTARVELLRASLPPSVDLAFAVKANPSLAVLAHLGRLGVGADVASGGELEAAIVAGIPADRIVFTGPGKTDAELGRALRLGIRALTIESLDELDVVIDLADLARPGQGLLLRLAIDGSSEDRPIIGGPGSAKFGLTPDEVDEAIDRLHRVGAIGDHGAPFRLLGLHAFGASNMLDPAGLIDGIRRLAARSEESASRHGLAVELLDGGGGLGIPYGDGEHELDLAGFGSGLAQELATWPLREPLSGARLLLEPGRFLAGPTGAFLMRVTRTKARHGRKIAVVDGGMHHLARPALMGQEQRVVAVGGRAVEAGAVEACEVTVDVVGPLCTGLDVLATGVRLPEPRSGDLLAILDAGAYGFTESMPYFLSHPGPAEVVVLGGRAHLARPPLDPGEQLARQAIPA